MPAEEGAHDLAAKGGVIASHRWLGANTATPLFYGAKKQLELTTAFLRDKVLNVDIFSLTRAATGEVFAPLDSKSDNRLTMRAGEEVSVEVVVANRKAAHSFPPELRDMYEPWVEFEALDSEGRTVFHSGFIRPDQTLDESAHVYKAILLDESGRVVTRHQMWATRVKAYDNAVPSGRTDIARYSFRVPEGAGASAALTLRARVNYRRFIQEYTDHVLQKHGAAQLRMPVVCMAEAEVKVVAATPSRTVNRRARDGDEQRAAVALENLWRRWNDYGIGLMEQAQYGAASRAFGRASELKPNDPDSLISAAVAEMKTERFGPERAQLVKARELLERALKLAPTLGRARFSYALLLRSEGRPGEAADELTRISREFPRDREVLRQLGQTLYGLGRLGQSRAAFESLLAVEPNDTGAYQFLAPLYKSEGRTEEAARADALYILWRDDPLADRLAARFFALNPQWAEERVQSHAHGSDSPQRPTLTGRFAAP
jgi:tetratricopeptide (TPR) repeat protein